MLSLAPSPARVHGWPWRSLLASAVALSCALNVHALAQPATPEAVRVAVIVADSGAYAERGALERTVAEAWAVRSAATGGAFGVPFEVSVHPGGGQPDRAVRAAREAADDGAHVLICCSAAAASAAVARVAAEARLPLLSVSAGTHADGVGWQFVLAPSDAVTLQATVRDAYARGARRLGLMTLDGSFGDDIEARLRSFLGVPDLTLSGVARYRPNAAPLTPEALLVATTEPHAIIVWGTREDTLRAVSGLRARGWQGPVYLRSALLDPWAGGVPGGLTGDVRAMVSPAALADAPEGMPDAADASIAAGASWRFDARTLGDGALQSRPYAADGALMHDALELLRAGVEEALNYGVHPSAGASFRQALRDALVAKQDVTFAAGRYDPSDATTDAARADGLVAAAIARGALQPLR